MELEEMKTFKEILEMDEQNSILSPLQWYYLIFALRNNIYNVKIMPSTL